MSKREWKKGSVIKVNPLTTFTVRVLSVGHVELEPHQWLVPKSNSLFWSIYIPEYPGLELGSKESTKEVPAGLIGLVPPGASAARDNTEAIRALFFHFDIGGLAGLQLTDHLNEIAIVSAEKFQSQIGEIEEAVCAGNDLRLQLCAQELLAGVLADCVSRLPGKESALSTDDVSVQQILPAIYAVEERLNATRSHTLRISEMAEMCGLKAVDFSRVFFEATGRNPAKYSQERKIAVAAQSVLFSDKSIQEISEAFAFANRFYFSRVFKGEVGETPAAYRAAFRVEQ